jgi:hypothetical protein
MGTWMPGQTPVGGISQQGQVEKQEIQRLAREE